MSMTAHISDLVFFLSRCHVEGAGQKGDREDSQGLCHHWFCCVPSCQVHLHWQGRGGVEDQGLGRVGLQWNQAAEGDPESPPHGGLDPNEIEFLLNLTNNLVRFLEKVQ